MGELESLKQEIEIEKLKRELHALKNPPKVNKTKQVLKQLFGARGNEQELLKKMGAW